MEGALGEDSTVEEGMAPGGLVANKGKDEIAPGGLAAK
jgi:hypothetical protein